MNDEPAWYVLRTQIKRERLAAVNLRQLEGVEVFLPRLKYQKSTRRGRVWWSEPLFPGYLLAKFPFIEMGRMVTYTAGVSRVIQFGDDVPAVPGEFVEGLKAEVAKLEGGGEEVGVKWKVNVGDEVEIAAGPFRGMEGQVVEVRPAAERVSLLLEFLGEMKPIEMNLFDLILSQREIPRGWQNDER